MNEIWVWGAGGHASSVMEVASAAGWKIAGLVDPYASGSFHGYEIFPDFPEDPDSAFDAVIAIGDNRVRRKVADQFRRQHPNGRFPALAHPSASVAANATIGEGSVIFQNAVIGAASRIGKLCVINSSSSLDHECAMGDVSSVAPGVTTGGRVTMGSNVFVGIGATVLQGRRIVDDVVVGAASLVTGHLDRPGLYFGTPARWVKSYAEVGNFLS